MRMRLASKPISREGLSHRRSRRIALAQLASERRENDRLMKRAVRRLWRLLDIQQELAASMKAIEAGEFHAARARAGTKISHERTVNDGPTMAQVGAGIRCLREKLGLTHGDFAKRLGTRANTVKAWEAGEKEPREKHLRQMIRRMLP
jgi:DNA-binding transcriptional regulator YiaG